MMSAELSKALRAKFPTLTVKRLEAIWVWVVRLPRGVIPDTLDPEITDPIDLIAALVLCRELEHRNTEQLQKIIKRLSAAKKRRDFPKSYGV